MIVPVYKGSNYPWGNHLPVPPTLKAATLPWNHALFESDSPHSGPNGQMLTKRN